ncbi:hypothetical protein E1B28_010672 [Marasmius oreades]|uniref:HMG box domain-containing protein n=1 Tax=Marasmius oreades TaxID=181124 RepID=A0A9P7USX5_9AGAR|nr:uncharacterized protein E1B28_010672 [Marasmius oreades]KAG7091651.1 hypothetical protein E1B28_010672 [Marasmius oreades]
MAQRKSKKARAEVPVNDTECSSSKNNQHVKRPPNPWVLYRSHTCKALEFEGMQAPQISRIIATRWRALSAQDRLYWERLGEKTSLEHAIRHPGYKYQPRKPVEGLSNSKRTRKGNKKARQVVEEADVVGEEDDETAHLPKNATSSSASDSQRGAKRDLVSPAASSSTLPIVATAPHDLVALPIVPSTSATEHRMPEATQDSNEVPEGLSFTALPQCATPSQFPTPSGSYYSFTLQCPSTFTGSVPEFNENVHLEAVEEEPAYPTLSLDEDHMRNQFTPSPVIFNDFDVDQANIITDPGAVSSYLVDNFGLPQSEHSDVVDYSLLHLPQSHGFEPVYGRSAVVDYGSLDFEPYPPPVVDHTLTEVTNDNYDARQPLTYYDEM